ncbi:MAG: Uma2 family endonuclease, partial [Bacteroidota bacterium]
MITSLDQLDLSKTYSYADYLNWRFDEMVELLRGRIFKMSPAPSRKHQEISMNLIGVLLPYFKRDTTCKLYHAPFDVRLYNRQKSVGANQEIFTVVQPDLCVICDPEKIDEQGCNGAPDLIIEILSPGNSKKEMKIKYALYEECGVKEYWVIYPTEESLLQFVLDQNGKYVLKDTFSE